MTTEATPLVKRRTGIAGLDEVTLGGLPAAGAVLIAGQAGAGKTVLCLQILSHAAAADRPVVFVSFEESVEQIERDALSFNWGRALLDSGRCHLIDARPPANARAAGDFDLDGLRAAIGAQLEGGRGSWVVLDGIDRLLRLHPDAGAAVDQIAGLNHWCEAQRITLLLTAKRTRSDSERTVNLEGIEFMLGTVLGLSLEVADSRLNRRFRIEKYRGSGHIADEMPMMMDGNGLHLPYAAPFTGAATATPVSGERLSTGVPRLDKVLDGGLYRGSSTLISGQPGTAKTTLSGSIANAAAERGETVLYLSFDELADRIVRNLASVGIELEPHIRTGRLHLHSREAWRSLVEEHYVAVNRLIDEVRPDCLIIDPISALMKAASVEQAHTAAERILSTARARGITTIITSLSETQEPEQEATLSHTSTLADTWISLAYAIQGGERNRSLSVVKSRGSAHSNQVRELRLSNDGIDLVEVYRFGSEVLMGTARVQKENEEAAANRELAAERTRRRTALERDIEQARQRLKGAESEARRLEAELDLLLQSDLDADYEENRYYEEIRRQRDADSNVNGDHRERGGDR